MAKSIPSNTKSSPPNSQEDSTTPVTPDNPNTALGTPVYRIFIDGREANTSQRVGSNVYAFEVLHHLSKRWQSNPSWQVTVGLTQPPLKDLPKERPGWRYEFISPAKLWTQWALPLYLFMHRSEFDLVFTPSHYAPRLSPVPSVITIFDLAFLSFPDQFRKTDFLQLKHWTAYSARQAAKIITISNYSKKTICETYRRQPGDVFIAYPAVTAPTLSVIQKRSAQTFFDKVGIEEPFLLYVGTIQPRKNIITMVEAFEQIKRQIGAGSLPMSKKKLAALSRLQLVIAGKIGWLATDIIDRIQASPFSKEIILTGYVDETVKWTLLQRAVASFQLGTHEGFGIPALEAITAGSPVIAINSSSLPEVVGEAGLLVTPNSTKAVTQAVRTILSYSSKQQAQLQRAAREQARVFSWADSAQTVETALLKVLKSPK